MLRRVVRQPSLGFAAVQRRSASSTAKQELLDRIKDLVVTSPDGSLRVPKLMMRLTPHDRSTLEDHCSDGLVPFLRGFPELFAVRNADVADATSPLLVSLKQGAQKESAKGTPVSGLQADTPAASSDASPDPKPSAPGPSPSSSASDGRADRMQAIWDAVSPLIASAPAVSQMSSVYSALEPSMRSEIRKTFGSLKGFFEQVESSVACVAVSKDGLRVCSMPADGRPRPNTLDPVESTPTQRSSPDMRRAMKAVSKHGFEKEWATALEETSDSLNSPLHHTMSESLDDVYQPSFTDFVPPEPPQAAEYSKEAQRVASRTDSDAVVTGEMLIPLIPPFFIPMEEALQVLPDGYSEGHVEQLFGASGTIEIVRLEGSAFVRLHGAGSRMNMRGSAEAVERFKQYEPDPALCDDFDKAIPGKGGWHSLREVIGATPPEVVARLPYHRYKSLLYFAQMQHRFCFMAEGPGAVAKVPEPSGLDYDTSPVPYVVNQVSLLLGEENEMSADLLLSSIDRLHDPLLTGQLEDYFGGSIERFVSAHDRAFFMDPETRMIMTTRKREMNERRNMTLEEKLEEAIAKGEKRDQRKIRRKMMIARDPTNPLLDNAKLVEAVASHMPRKQHINVRKFLKNLPPEIVDLMPAVPLKLFQKNPQFFTLFEYKEPNAVHVQRPQLPLPEGALRSRYTEEELIRQCATALSGKPKKMASLFSSLPYAAKEQTRKEFKDGLLGLLKQYPQYFSIVFRDTVKMDPRTAVITLLAEPEF